MVHRAACQNRRGLAARPRVEALEGRALAVATVFPAGSLDPTFGSNGVAVSAIGSAATALNALAVQADGKVVAVGAVSNQGIPRSRWFVERFTTAGRLDPTFGVGGVVVVDFTLGLDHADSVLVDPFGRIVVGGGTGAGFGAVVRLNPDGTLDPSFGVAGRAVGPVTSLRSVTGLAQSNGRLLATGPSSSASATRFVVAALGPLGTADTGFGVNGVATLSTGLFGAGAATAVAVGPNGSVILAGTVGLARVTPPHAGVAVFSAAGFPLGAVVVDYGTGLGDSATSLAVQPDGKVVVAGSTRVVTDLRTRTVAPAFALARLTPDPLLGLRLDPTFGAAGRVVTPSAFRGGISRVAVALQPDGKVLAAGGAGTASLTALRYDAAGKLDPAFGTKGVAVVPIGQVAFTSALAVQPSDGKILVGGGGAFVGTPVYLGLARLRPRAVVAATGPPAAAPRNTSSVRAPSDGPARNR